MVVVSRALTHGSLETVNWKPAMACIHNEPSPCMTMQEAYHTGTRECACAGQIPVATRDASCPTATPFRFKCTSESTGPQFCCRNLTADADPSCEVGPKQTGGQCDAVLGGGGAGYCFQQSTNCPPNLNPTADGQPVQSCPIIASTEKGAQVCKTWCQANPEACNAAMRQYCSASNFASTPACACIAHAQPWGALSFQDLQAIVQANPKVQEQLDRSAGGALDASCVWPPCITGGDAVMVPQFTGSAAACPTDIGNLCVNLVADVQLKDVEAGNVTVGECIAGGTAAADTGSAPQVQAGLHTLPFGTQLKAWVHRNPLFVLLALLGLLAIVSALLWVLFRPPTSAQAAMAADMETKLRRRRARVLHRLGTNMASSHNTAIQKSGKELLQHQQDVRNTHRAALRARAAALQTSIRALRSAAPQDQHAAMRIASMTTEEEGLLQRAAFAGLAGPATQHLTASSPAPAAPSAAPQPPSHDQ